MKKKFIYFSSLILTTLLLLVTIYLNNTYSMFNSKNVKSTIYILSSSTLNGRLSGSIENDMTAKLIANKFESYGLVPLAKDFSDNFIVTCPVPLDTEAHLNISKDGSIIKTLKYGVDYKEDMINFKQNSFNFSITDSIRVSSTSIEVTNSDGKFIFYVPKNNDFSFRSSFSSDFSYDLAVMITENTLNILKDNLTAGNSISLHIPFSTEEKIISNVVGVLEGSNKNLPPLVLTAHYDHLGSDGTGNTYVGALDNASGTAFILELCRSLSTFGKPSRDIVFVAFNAEEFGLLGSKHFAETYITNIKNSEVINFDMIGSSEVPLTFIQGTSYKDANSALLNSIEEISTSLDIPFKTKYQDSSDHASFNNLNIDSVTFCHDDLSRIHTPNDKIDFIDNKAINSAYAIIANKIFDSCYNPFIKSLYSPKFIFFISTLLMILVSIFIFDKKHDLYNTTGIRIFSVCAILLIALSLILKFKGCNYAMLVILIYSFAGIALNIKYSIRK